MKRKWTAFLMVIAVFSAVLFACGNKAAEETEYIGIISAMDNEIDILLKEAKIDRTDTVAGVDYHIGMLRDQPVIITRAGIGKVRASSAVTAMLDKYPVSTVVF